MTSRKWILAIVGLFAMAASLKLVLPSLAADSAWTISDVFSFMRSDGEFSSLAYDYMETGHGTNMLSYLLSPLFLLLGISTYSLIVVGLGFNLLTILLIIYFRKHLGSALAFCLALAFITSGYFSHFRYEGYLLPILLAQIILMVKWMSNRKIIFAVMVSFLSSIAFFIHPMGAIISFLLLVIPLFYEVKELKKYLVFIPISLIFLFVFGEGNIIQYISYWANSPEESHTFDGALIFKFLIFSPVFVYLLYSIYFKSRSRIAIVLITIAICIIILFGRSYYFQYLLPILVSILGLESFKRKILANGDDLKTINNPKFFYTTLAAAVSLNILMPFGLLLENPKCINVQKETLVLVRDSAHAISNSEHKIYVEPSLGMEVAKYSNGRIYYPFYPRMAGYKITLTKGDYFICSSPEQMNYIIPKVTNHTVSDFDVTEAIAPVKGMLRPGKLFKERGPEVGLYFLVKK